MQKQIHLLLAANEVGQILDGLEIREQAWRKTAHFLKTGHVPNGAFFLAEECSNADEATKIADDYKAIIGRILKQRANQTAATTSSGGILSSPKKGTSAGFAIYTDTIFQGRIPIERNDSNLPVVYETELAAQREIAECAAERLAQFLAGERPFDDGFTLDEYVAPVQLHPDGSITDESGETFPNPNW